MEKRQISAEVIESFLEGTDPQKYIVAVEAGYHLPKVTLIINDPAKGKYKELHDFQPFLWFKEEIGEMLYEGKKMKRIEAGGRWGVKIRKLQTTDEFGNEPKRMANGYKYKATCTKTYNDLIGFFREGGVDIYDKAISSNFVSFSPAEQFLISTGKRLFKGIDDYNDIHRFQFDLETTGLFGNRDKIFQIGVRDNRGFEAILEVRGDSEQERRDNERLMIDKFFKVIDALKPDVITGYNSDNFDWNFIFDRGERLSIPIENHAITLDHSVKIKRKETMLKLGGEVEHIKQTHMYGYNIIDIAHAVRRAQAINSDIKQWTLKYITKFSKVAKPNRVYVPGDKIHTIWNDTVQDYAFNETNGDWYVITEARPLKEGYEMVKGDFIIQRYLLDDLWETEQVDTIFNQASFLIAKLLPTTYMRSSTMGTAGQWKLLMAAWSFENGLAIPSNEPKRDFTGGLSRLLEVGYARNVVKLDFAALYPKIELTHDIFPDLDISGAMKGMLTYVVDKRDEFKALTGKHKKALGKLKDELKENKGNWTIETKEEFEKKIAAEEYTVSLYDKKQLPLKILANSWFGSYGAPYIFNWGESDCAEETTCRGRQYLRLMVKHFCEKHGFRALVGDTDGFNFAFPDDVKNIKYLAKGSHWKTTADAGKELSGLDAVLAEFNENYMNGRMGLDIDDICNSTINFSRKNYANDIGGKIKLVGNSIKSKKMPTYIEEFLNIAVRMLLDGKGYDFIEYYYEYTQKIYNFGIPLVKIASKAKVKSSMQEYRKKATMKNKAGKPMPKQAHMELALRANLSTNVGDVLYYVNTGAAKSHGDLKSVKNKETGLVDVQLNCKLIDSSLVESDTELIKELEVAKKDLTIAQENNDTKAIEALETRIEQIDKSLNTDEYNVARYLEAFNKKIRPLLVCFDKEIRDKIVVTIKKDKKDKVEKLQDRSVFTRTQCELSSGQPNKPEDQDSYEELMKMEDKEIKFWSKVNKVPNNMERSEWEEIRADYEFRLALAKADGIQYEKDKLDDIFKHLEISDYKAIREEGQLQIDIFIIADVDTKGSPFLISRKWDVPLVHIEDVFKYEPEAIARAGFYNSVGREYPIEERYEKWLDYKAEMLMMTGSTSDVATLELGTEEYDNLIGKILEGTKEIVLPSGVTVEKPKKATSEDDEDEDVEDNGREDDSKKGIIIDEGDDFEIVEEVEWVRPRPNIPVYAYTPTPKAVVEEPKLEPVEEPVDEMIAVGEEVMKAELASVEDEDDEWNF